MRWPSCGITNEQAIRRKVENTLRTLFELYDFDKMSSTILNELDLLTSKYAGGDEICLSPKCS